MQPKLGASSCLPRPTSSRPSSTRAVRHRLIGEAITATEAEVALMLSDLVKGYAAAALAKVRSRRRIGQSESCR